MQNASRAADARAHLNSTCHPSDEDENNSAREKTYEHAQQTNHGFLTRILEHSSSAMDVLSPLGVPRQTFAFSSPTLPDVAKCTLRLAFVAPPATPHRALSDPERHRRHTRTAPGNTGDRRSSIRPRSLNISARNRYFLQSASSAIPKTWANSMVASRPIESVPEQHQQCCIPG